MKVHSPPKIKKIIPTEAQEMKALMDWANLHPKLKHPLFGNILVHIPNEGKRTLWSGKALFSSGGCKRGFPDIFLPIANSAYNGLLIELKRINFKFPKKMTEYLKYQMEWNYFLVKQGYYFSIAKGANEAIESIDAYLKINV